MTELLITIPRQTVFLMGCTICLVNLSKLTTAVEIATKISLPSHQPPKELYKKNAPSLLMLAMGQHNYNNYSSIRTCFLLLLNRRQLSFRISQVTLPLHAKRIFLGYSQTDMRITRKLRITCQQRAIITQRTMEGLYWIITVILEQDHRGIDLRFSQPQHTSSQKYLRLQSCKNSSSCKVYLSNKFVLNSSSKSSRRILVLQVYCILLRTRKLWATI